MITYKDIKSNEKIKAYIKKAYESLSKLGYTEHSFAHVGLVAKRCEYILSTLGYSQRDVELAKISSYNAAKSLHLTDRGVLKEGMLADIVLLDSDLNLKEVYKLGKRVR